MTDSTRDITRTQVPLRLDSALLPEIDARAKALGISRNQWFENMARWCLDNTVTIERRS